MKLLASPKSIKDLPNNKFYEKNVEDRVHSLEKILTKLNENTNTTVEERMDCLMGIRGKISG